MGGKEMICPKCKEEKFCGIGDRPCIEGAGLVCSVCGWSIPEYLPSPNKNIIFPRDIDYFKEYSAPIFENMQRLHFTLVNSTIPFFGPMLYLLVRQLDCNKVLEIGHAEGYTSFYLASGVKDNATRYNRQGNLYYGIDIVQTGSAMSNLESAGLPAVVSNLDSMNLTSDTFPGVVFDMIFQDGNHDADHVVYEFNTMWPQLRGNGDGYWVAHDCYGPAEEGCKKLMEIIKEKEIPVEYVRFGGHYGLLIIRKM